MCKVISIISCKGGVGKTTSAVNISSFFQMEGNRVCVIDFYSQHNLSNHFGIFPGHLKNRPTIYDLLHSSINFDDEKCLFESIDPAERPRFLMRCLHQYPIISEYLRLSRDSEN